MYATDYLAKAAEVTEEIEGLAHNYRPEPDRLATLYALLAIAQRLDTLAVRPS
jgi:hypothetical protein